MAVGIKQVGFPNQPVSLTLPDLGLTQGVQMHLRSGSADYPSLAVITIPGNLKMRYHSRLDLNDLVNDRIIPAEFFAENFITGGMKTLL